MSLIMTAHGWKRLVPLCQVGCYNYPLTREPVHTPSLLEAAGLSTESVADQYCEAIQRFKLPRSHPAHIDERQMLSIMGAKKIVPGFHVRGWPK